MKTALELPAFAAEIESQRQAKKDYVTDTRNLRVTSTLDEAGENVWVPNTTLTVDGVGDFQVNDHCHGQIAGRLGIPTKFYDRLRGEYPDLHATTVNRLLAEPTKPERRMVRTLDYTPGEKIARAFLSDRYRRIDNADIIERLYPVVVEAAGDGVTFPSCAVTDNRIYLKAVTPRLEATVANPHKVGDIVRGGVCISNSEVGGGALGIWAFVERLICTNGMVVPIIPTSADGERLGLRKYHVGRRIEGGDDAYQIFSDSTMKLDDDAFFAKAADVVRACMDTARFQVLVGQFGDLAAIEIDDTVGTVERLVQTHDLDEREQTSILNHLIAGGEPSAWGIVNAITRTAEDADTYERAVDLERLGGLLATQPAQNWRAN